MIPILTTFLKYCPSPELLNWRYTFPHLSKIDFPRARCWPPKRRFLPRLLRRCSVAAACECRSLHSAVYKFTASGMLWEIPLKKTFYKKKILIFDTTSPCDFVFGQANYAIKLEIFSFLSICLLIHYFICMFLNDCFSCFDCCHLWCLVYSSLSHDILKSSQTELEVGHFGQPTFFESKHIYLK